MSESKSQRLARQLGIYDEWEKVHEEMMIQCAALKKTVRHMVRKMAGERTPASARAGDERGEGSMAIGRRSERFRGLSAARDGASSGRPRGNRVRGGGGGGSRKLRAREQLPQIRGGVSEARARRAAAGPRGATPPKRQRVGGRGDGGDRDRDGRGTSANAMELEPADALGRQRGRSGAPAGRSGGSACRGDGAMDIDFSGGRPRSRSEAGGASPSRGLLRSESGGADAYQSRMQSFKSKLRCVARVAAASTCATRCAVACLYSLDVLLIRSSLAPPPPRSLAPQLSIGVSGSGVGGGMGLSLRPELLRATSAPVARAAGAGGASWLRGAASQLKK